MATNDPRALGLDPAHVLGVALQALGSGHGHGGRVAALAEPGCVRVRLSSRRAAAGAAAALTRVGYQVTRISGVGRSDVLVSGWSAAGLEFRLATMRNVLYNLDASPLFLANAAIERSRRRPAGAPALPDAAALAEARAELRARVSARSGVHVPHVSAILPADRGNALRLRTAWSLETAVDRLIERQMRAAGDALSLFGSLRQHTTDDVAQQITIRRVGLTVRPRPSEPDGSLARDSPALIRRVAPPPARGPRISGPQPDGWTPAGPVRQAARDFPYPITSAITADDATTALPARPGGRLFPASRPGPRL